MIKLGCFSFMYDRETSTTVEDPLRFIDFAHSLRLDVVDFDINKGFPSQERDYLMQVKLAALRRGLTIGMIDGGGSFVGTDGELRQREWDGTDFYAFMEQTVHLASYVRAKVFKIDQGWEEWFDYERIAGILKSANYNGVVSIYYLGKNFSSCDDYEGITLAVSHLRGLLGDRSN